MARVYDNGSLFSISLNQWEISGFRSYYPGSGLGGLKTLWVQFEKHNGDLVDLQCNKRYGCERYDGPGLLALIETVQCFAARKLGLSDDIGRCTEYVKETWEHMGLTAPKVKRSAEADSEQLKGLTEWEKMLLWNRLKEDREQRRYRHRWYTKRVHPNEPYEAYFNFISDYGESPRQNFIREREEFEAEREESDARVELRQYTDSEAVILLNPPRNEKEYAKLAMFIFGLHPKTSIGPRGHPYDWIATRDSFQRWWAAQRARANARGWRAPNKFLLDELREKEAIVRDGEQLKGLRRRHLWDF